MSTFGIPNVAPELEAQLISQMADVEALLRSHTRSEYPFVDETAHHLEPSSSMTAARPPPSGLYRKRIAR